MTPLEETHIAAISHTIQLAIAPVFLLTAIGTIINALISRLARSVDRRRQVEEILPAYEGATREKLEAELEALARRIQTAMRAIVLAVVSALVVCLLIGTAFAAAFVSIDLSRPVALLFIIAMIALTGSLLFFLHEVFMAAQAVHPRAWPQPTRDDRT